MQIKSCFENPYAGILCSYFNTEFPEVTSPNSKELLDILTGIILGTKEVRYGSLPTPEAVVTIRQVIRKAIENDMPIPVMVPWGSIKSNFTSDLDIAEVSALLRVNTLHNLIKRYYTPGIEAAVRIEDTSGYTLFQLEGNSNQINRSIDSYTEDLSTLIRLISPDHSIIANPESCMNNATIFESGFNINKEIMLAYLMDTKDLSENAVDFTSRESYKRLNSIGWRGIISSVQRNYYLDTYKRLYPGWDTDMHIKRLSLYFAGALTRHQLKMTGRLDHWNDGFIQLAFVPPISGLPEGYNNNYVYYRTLPLSQARTHISPWRAKGYFKIQGNSITAKLASFGDQDLLQSLLPAAVELYDDTKRVRIKTDYLLID